MQNYSSYLSSRPFLLPLPLGFHPIYRWEGERTDGVESGKQHACSACRDQRRRCEPDSPLAHYFPRHQTGDYKWARRLLGLSKFSKVRKSCEGRQRHRAMWCKIFQAHIRRDDPVRGAFGVACWLKDQIR